MASPSFRACQVWLGNPPLILSHPGDTGKAGGRPRIASLTSLRFSLDQVRDANCRAFIHHAAQGDTELLANLPDQRIALQHTALACLVGASREDRIGQRGQVIC